jgi:hydrogenase nickel incorporation protein HypB
VKIQVGRKVLEANDTIAAENRNLFSGKGLLTINLMSSPGSGKTTILEKTLKRILPDLPAAVIVGDVCTTNDAVRLARSGAPVKQITTDAFGGDCHLAAHMIREAAAAIDLDAIALLFLENVGNLVCPAEFDLGEDLKGVVLSVTEGEDKPLKYPQIFRNCDFTLLNKIDLLPYLDFDKDAALENIRVINPRTRVFEVSGRSEAGFDPWVDWLREKVRGKRKSSFSTRSA